MNSAASRPSDPSAQARHHAPAGVDRADLPLRHNRRFVSLYLADTISGFGDRIHALALYIVVFNLTGRALDVGALAIAQVLPAALIAPVAGWITDRVDRRRLLIYMDVLRCGLVLLVPTATSLTQILMIATLLAAARQFHEPARLAALPEIVGSRRILQANALSSATLHLLLLVGPAVGGVLIAALGTSGAFRIDACTYVASALLLLAVGRLPAPLPAALRARPAAAREAAALASVTDGAEAAVPPRGDRGSLARRFVQETRSGLSAFWADPALRFALGFIALTVLIVSLQQPLLVVFVRQILRAGDAQLGLVMSMAGLGGILGALLVQPVRRRCAPLRLIPLVCAADGCALLLFALTRSLTPALVLVAIFGLLAGLNEVHLVSFIQERVPEQVRGRAFAWLGPLFGPLSIASIGLGTLLADRLGVVPVLLASGLLEAAWALAALWWLRRRPLLAETTALPGAAVPATGNG